MPDANTRRLVSEIANHARWSKATETDKARQGRVMREKKRVRAAARIDPEGKLTPDQLAKALEHARYEEMARMRLAKQRKKEGRKHGA